MSKKIKNEQKKFLGETLNQYDKALNEGINQLDKKNREQNHKISSLVNSFDNEYLEKDVEGNMTALENSKDGMVIINEIQGNTEVNYCKDGEKELILNGDIDTQGESFVTITEGVDGGLVDVSLEGNTEINLSKTKDPVLVTREFDDINCNVGKLQYTIDDVTTINDEPGKVDIDRIVGDTMVNHAVNGSEELILNAHINESGDNNITLNGVTSDGGKVDVVLEGNTLVNVSNVKDDYITPTIEDKVDQGSVISLPEVSEGLIHIDEIEGNTMVNYCTDGAKELTLNGDIDVEGVSVTTTEGVDNGLVDVVLEGNTLVNLCQRRGSDTTSLSLYGTSGTGKIDVTEIENGCKYTTNSDTDSYITVRLGSHTIMKPSTTYTLIFEIEKNTLNFDYHGITVNGVHDSFFGHGGNILFYDGNFALTVGIKKINFTTPSDISTYTGFGYGFPNITTTEPGMEFVIKNTMLLEGDWTDKEIPQYFEGMKSVGQDDINGDKVEVVSAKGKPNLIKNSGFLNGKSNYVFHNGASGEIIDDTSSQSGKVLKMTTSAESGYSDSSGVFQSSIVSYIENKKYTLSGWCKGEIGTKFDINIERHKGIKITFTDENWVRFVVTSEQNPINWNRNITFYSPDLSKTFYLKDIKMEESDIDTPYIPHTTESNYSSFMNKKEILLNEPLRSLPNGTKDRFVKIGGKWFIERNCVLYTFDGSEYWRLVQGTYPYIEIQLQGIKHTQSSIICDKLPVRKDGTEDMISDVRKNICGIQSTNTPGAIRMRVGDLSQTLEDSKTWLANNNVSAVFELATPTYEPLEIEPTLNTYTDTTHLSNNSIIPCNMQIKNTGYNCILKPNTLYTVAVDTNENGTIGINLAGAEVTVTNNVATITTPNTLTDDSLRIHGKGIKGSKVRLLEGDKTNWIPSFFEGMKSSFEDKLQEDGSYKMEILSKDGNLIDIEYQALVNKASGMTCDFIAYKDLPCWQIRTQSYTEYYNYFRCKYEPNTQYSLSFDCEMIEYNDDRIGVEISVIYADGTIQGEIINKDTKRVEITTSSNKTVQRIRFQSWGYNGTLNMYNMQLIKSDTPKTTMEKSNSIQLSSIAPLRGIGDIHDRLVFKDGKLMIERRCKGVTLDGSDDEGWFLTSNPSANTTRFRINVVPTCYGDLSGYCDKFNVLSNTNPIDMESISLGDAFTVRILNSKLQTQDVAGFKQWLQDNPTTVVYALAEPTYEEVEYDLQKIILKSYANGTLFIDTNIPPTKVSFNCFEEELTYLYPATSYTIQFVSDKAITVDITLGGTQLLAQSIVKGLNRISITTPETLVGNKLVINGAGAKIKDMVVTDTDREFMYFEGMKSVGECEELEVRSNNKNLFDYNKFCEFVDEIKSSNPDGYYYHGFKIKVKPNTYYKLAREDNSGLGLNCYIVINDLENGYNSKSDFSIWIAHPTSSNLNASIRGFNTGNRNYIYINIAFTSDTPDDIINNIKRIMSTVQIEEGSTATDYIPHQSNTQHLTHEPLRAVGDAKDRYVLIDGKWYIERNCGEVQLNSDTNITFYNNHTTSSGEKRIVMIWNINNGCPKMKNDYECLCDNIKADNNRPWVGDLGIKYVTSSATGLFICVKYDDFQNPRSFKQWLSENPTSIIYLLASPQYEPINYNPLEVYSDITHITTNSAIPTNITVKNHGYNMVALKENTQYTLYVNKDTTNALTYRLGDYIEINSLSKFTFTTPSTLTDKTLRIDGKGAKVKDLMLIEGTPTNDSIGYFDGLKSSYECEQVTDENDENYGKYKVDVKVVGKNLFDENSFKEFFSTYEHNYKPYKIMLKPNTTYTFSDKTGEWNACMFFLELLDGDKKLITHLIDTNIANRKSFTFNTNSSNTFYLRMYTNDISKMFNISSNFMIEQGDTATEYEPYFESKQTVYLNSPLLKGDEIVWKDNKIQHYHKMKAVVLDGSDDENIDMETTLIKDNTIGFKYYNDNIISSTYCDKFMYEFSFDDKEHYVVNPGWVCFMINKDKLQTLDATGFKQWLQQNPVTVVYLLGTPYYEEISDYPLKLNVIANSSLSTESTIQVTNISFNIYEETLPYLYPNTKYYITFNADVDRNNIIINLGGNHVVFDCKVGFNKVEITTPSDTTNLLTFSGTGVNIDHVKVTQQDIDEYFEGMKSVGECEELEITSANSDNSLSNTQRLTHEPLRGINHIKDRYVIIDGKWYIERNIIKYVLNGNEAWSEYYQFSDDEVFACYHIVNEHIVSNSFKCDQFKKTVFNANDNSEGVDTYYVNNTNYVPRLKIKKYKLPTPNIDGFKAWLRQNPITIIARLASPIYEPINYNPFEVYAHTTHITTNSLIPTNVVVKNHGYNCILKPSTKYTIALNKPNGIISAKLGGSAKVDSTNSIFTITTPSTLNDNVLRLSGGGNVKDIMILEGDKTVNTPSYFEGIESVFEQEYDTEKGKYRVTARVEGNGKESSIIFYLNEPLRGTATAKDKVFIQDGKVVVERNCGSTTFDGSDDEEWLLAFGGSWYIGSTTAFISYKHVEKVDLLHKFYCDNFILKDGNFVKGDIEQMTFSSGGVGNYICIRILNAKLATPDINGFKQWLQQNPTTIVYQLAEPVYEEVDCDLSKLALENYENSSLIFESNIPVSANIRYSGEVPVVTQAKALSSKVDNTTFDINENIIPYMCDIDYRIVELQLMNGDTQGEGIELLGIGDIEILGNENVLFNNREDKKYNYSYDMLKRDILSQRYSKEEYQYRLDRYLLANKISDKEYKELEGLLNNGE